MSEEHHQPENHDGEQPQETTGEEGESNLVNGDAQPKACDIIRITGLPENCEAAKQALIDNIPITVEVSPV